MWLENVMKVMGIILRFALVTTMPVTIFLPFCGGPAAPAQAPVVTNDLNGTWFNVDAKTRGLVQIEIHDNKIHPYGACHPDPCDWGTLKAKSFAQTVDSGLAVALTAKQSTSFSRVEITLSLQRDGRLRAEMFTHFTDGSGRVDYRTVNYFTHFRPAYAP
jgi:hypothetical protein